MIRATRALYLLFPLIATACDAFAAAETSTARPNIVFVLTDDMGYSDPHCYGGNFAPTPRIDQLAREGVRFTHFYDSAPICSPSRAAFISGKFPASLNFTTYLSSRADNRNCEQADFLPTSVAVIARALKAAGYATAHFGKWHLGGGRDVNSAPPFSAYGYDEHIGTWESPEPDPKITATNWIWSPQDPVKRWDRTRYFVDRALDFLGRHKDRPCYVEVWPDDVHTPWVPDLKRQADKRSWETRPSFCDVLAAYDVQMGRLLDGLKKLGLEENTIFIFTSDNGPLPSFHHERTGGLRGSKLSLYEGGIRVPFIVRWPGHTTAGRIDERTVLAAVDLFPTLCAIAHASPPAGVVFDGQDMTAALLNAPIAHTKTIFWEYGRRSKLFKYPQASYDRSPHLAVRDGKWKLVVNADGSSTELYDMEADANETKNLAPQQPETTKRLRDAALAWRRSLPKFARPDSAPEAKKETRPGFGLWYTPWWTQDDQFQHWSHCHRLPLQGRYTAGAPAIIAAHYAQLRDLGADFLIMDDTNGVANDGGRINDNIRAWFDFMDAKPAAERIPICIGGGGEMRSEGKDPLEDPREGGQLYIREWLRVLKAHPQFVTVADWNNFEEETAMEDSYAWEDSWGYAVPDLYRRITRAYSRLRSDALVKGEYYRSESGPKVFLFDGRALTYQAGMPHRAAVILVPDEKFDALLRRQGG